MSPVRHWETFDVAFPSNGFRVLSGHSILDVSKLGKSGRFDVTFRTSATSRDRTLDSAAP